jgi:hypothetical protein
MPNTTAGIKFEDFVQNVITLKGLPVITYKEFKNNKSQSNVLVKHFPYISVFNEENRTEFVLLKDGRRIRIECKYQATKGSVDNGIYMAYGNAKIQPEEEILFVVEAKGMRPTRLQYLKDATQNNLDLPPDTKKYMRVMNSYELVKWAKNGFPHLSTI